MNKKISGAILVIVFCFSAVLQLSAQNKAESIAVKNGTAEYNGVKYPVFGGVKSISTTPEDSVYGKVPFYSLKAKNLQDGDKTAQKIIAFYKNKKIGSVSVKTKFEKNAGKEEIFYTSDNKEGKNSASIMIAVMKTGVDVVIIYK